jgi:Tfp pilus assembly protein PilN
MRDLEFLPDWYPTLQRRKRLVAVQAWVTLGTAMLLGVWMLFAQGDVQAKQRDLRDINGALLRSQDDVARLEVLLDLQRKLGHQAQIFAKIGRPIETTRILTTIEELMPRDVALLNLTMETEEPKAETLAAKAALEKNPIRRIKLKLEGVAPTDADLAVFLSKMTAKPFFSAVSLSHSRPRSDNQHVMREFEVTFMLDLSAMGAN